VAGNAGRAREALDAWNEGGLRALSDGWVPRRGDGGHAGRFRFLVKHVEEHGDLTLAELELVGEGAQSGAGFSGTVHQICRWRDGRTAEVLTFADREAADAALVGSTRQ
jgi:hypothetical protein